MVERFGIEFEQSHSRLSLRESSESHCTRSRVRATFAERKATIVGATLTRQRRQSLFKFID